jgi:hypothetical protein
MEHRFAFRKTTKRPLVPARSRTTLRDVRRMIGAQ